MPFCEDHEAFMNRIEARLEAGFNGVKGVINQRIDDLREDMDRRFSESLEDRRNLHASQNDLSREVTKAMTRLNGATLITVQPHHRTGDPPDSEYPRQDGPATAVAFQLPPKMLLIAGGILTLLAGAGLVLIFQTKLEINGIKAYQELHQVHASAAAPK